jgi:DNA-binding beta-propeller fold protein YncE
VSHVPQDLRALGLLALLAGGLSAAHADFTPALTVRHVNTYGKLEGGPLPRPETVTYDPQRKELYVTLPSDGQVSILSAKLVPLYRFQHSVRDALGNVVRGEPDGALAGKRGMIFIVDRLWDHLDVADFRGRSLRTINVSELLGGRAGLGRMDRDDAGNLYVVEDLTQTVLVLSPEGKLLRKIGSEGPKPDGAANLRDVAVGPDGSVYLVDATAEPCVRVFDAYGKYLTSFGSHSDKPEGLHMPTGVAVDAADRVWVTDCVAHEVKSFGRDGAVLAVVGGVGTADGRFYFPVDVACGEDGEVFVVERAGNRLQAFHAEAAPGSAPEGAP